jgi:integrase/recombinase XerD
MLDLATYGEKYMERLQVLNFAKRTIEGRRYALFKFFRFLGEMGVPDIAAVTGSLVRDYQTHLHEESNRQGEANTAGTQNNNLKVAKLFFRFLKEEDYLARDPSRDIPYAKVPKRLPRSILTKQEVRKLLRAPDTHSLMGYRDRAMLEVFYSTGLRNSELGALKVEDMDTVEGFVRVNLGKGGKDRVVPLGKIACRYVENYIKAVRPHMVRDPACSWLFLSLRGTPMSRTVIAQTVRRCAKKARLGKPVTAHSLRHTCATQMMRNKANLRHIQELLGHACLTTTQVYTSVTIADLKEAHQKYHPRERERGTL